jgi:diguanylate cyclase (GGDEF)-like protein
LDRREAALDRTSAADHLRGTYRDTLTGALRRDPGREELGREVDRAHRTKSPLVVAFLDVVRLKRVNDEQGHSAGDRVLSAVGVALRGGLRSYDRVVRYGGDEFVCALPGADLTDAARRFDEVGEMLGLASPGARISIGLVELQTDESLDGVIDRADRRLYEGRKVEAAGRAGDPARG